MEKSIGAIWKKQSKNGKEFMSGSLEHNGEKINFVVFANDYKKEDKHPDFKIFPKQVKEEAGDTWGA